MNRLALNLQDLKTGEALFEALEVLPDYTDDIRDKSKAYRLMALEDIYKIYVPSDMSIEIYNKLYMAMFHSLGKKEEKLIIEQQHENRKRILGNKSLGIIGGSDSFTIIGSSGIGKSSAIFRTIDLITNNKIIECENPFRKIIPSLIVQCPFDCSVKGLLFEVLRKVDEILDTNYYSIALKYNSTTDMLIGSVSQVAINHIGLLVVDEIQNVVNNKSGKSLVAMLTQLINNSGISICMVGTPEVEVFFESVDYLARRTIGLRYTSCPYGNYFIEVCEKVFKYQYTLKKTELTDSFVDWLYEHSGGILSNVIFLFHDTQELAILSDKEEISINLFNETYKQRMNMLHGFINSGVEKKKISKVKREKLHLTKETEVDAFEYTLKDLVDKAKKEDKSILTLLEERNLVIAV